MNSNDVKIRKRMKNTENIFEMGVVFGFVLSPAARNKMADDLSLPINNESHLSPLHLQHLPEEE